MITITEKDDEPDSLEIQEQDVESKTTPSRELHSVCIDSMEPNQWNLSKVGQTPTEERSFDVKE